MKFFAKILLGIFILFQFSSIIVYVVKERNKTNISLSITEEEEEEENAKEIKMVQTEFVICSEKLYASIFEKTTQEAQDTYLLKKYFASATIFLVPPEQV